MRDEYYSHCDTSDRLEQKINQIILKIIELDPDTKFSNLNITSNCSQFFPYISLYFNYSDLPPELIESDYELDQSTQIDSKNIKLLRDDIVRAIHYPAKPGDWTTERKEAVIQIRFNLKNGFENKHLREILEINYILQRLEDIKWLDSPNLTGRIIKQLDSYYFDHNGILFEITKMCSKLIGGINNDKFETIKKSNKFIELYNETIEKKVVKINELAPGIKIKGTKARKFSWSYTKNELERE